MVDEHGFWGVHQHSVHGGDLAGGGGGGVEAGSGFFGEPAELHQVQRTLWIF